jgi:hypothetical protein
MPTPPPHGQAHPLARPQNGADVARQSAAIPTKIQQLFDDAGAMGGLLQTASTGTDRPPPTQA